MTTEPLDPGNVFALPFLAEHLAWIDEHLRLADCLHKAGDKTINVDLQNQVSLLQYVRMLLLLLDTTEGQRKAAADRAWKLELARALRAYRRPVGRPRSVRLPALGTGLLGAFNEQEKPKRRKGGRPREIPEDFWPELNAAVAEAWAKQNGDSVRLDVTAGLRAVLTDFAESRNYSKDEAAKKITAIHAKWYSQLMKYRKRAGESIYSKSQNRSGNTANFAPLLENFGRLSTSNHSGKHQAVTKGRHGPQTGKARRQRK